MNTYTDTPNNIVYKVGEGLKKKIRLLSFQRDLKKNNKNLLDGGGSAKVHTEESAMANKD